MNEIVTAERQKPINQSINHNTSSLNLVTSHVLSFNVNLLTFVFPLFRPSLKKMHIL